MIACDVFERQNFIFGLIEKNCSRTLVSKDSKFSSRLEIGYYHCVTHLAFSVTGSVGKLIQKSNPRFPYPKLLLGLHFRLRLCAECSALVSGLLLIYFNSTSLSFFTGNEQFYGASGMSCLPSCALHR